MINTEVIFLENYDNSICLKDLFSNENGEKFLSISVLQTAFNVAYEGLILIDENYNILKINTMGLNILNSTEDKLKKIFDKRYNKKLQIYR